MTFVTLLLQTLFSVLVIAALAYGVRLNRKLVELRDGQAAFAKAVGELDGAASRAQAALETLRASTDTAQSELADRIDEARMLAGRLEVAAADAATALKRLEAAPHPRPLHPEPAREAIVPEDVRREPIIIQRALARAAEAAEAPVPAPIESSSARLKRVAELLRAADAEPAPVARRRAGARS
jgi:hypothetical protein